MRKPVSIALAIIAASVTFGAQAACRFKSERVLGCFPRDGQLAAQLFDQFGFNGEAMERSNVRTVLAQAGCRVIRSSTPNSFRIYRIGYLNVATMQGWRKVDFINVKTNTGMQPFEIADAYIVGVCDRPPRPVVESLPFQK
jgi:hypothetical protein